MMSAILSHTPTWVYAVFLGLVALGFLQARTRRVARIAAFLLPLGMIALSLAGIYTSFGLAAGPLASWAIAVVLATLLGYAMFGDPRVEYDPTADRFLIPGSWMPLAVIMAIFFAKYAYAVMRAFDTGVISSPFFVAAVSAVYGVLSGYFAARALHLVMTARAARATNVVLASPGTLNRS